MSDYLQQREMYEVRNAGYIPLHHIEAENLKSGKCIKLCDTLAEADEKAKAKKNNPANQGRPTLQAPVKNLLSQDDFSILAAAFSHIYTVMNQSLIDETNDYVYTQNLSQTQADCVLASTTNAINDEKNGIRIQSEISQVEETQAKDQKYFGWLTFGIGMLMTIASIAGGFITAGATDALVPEEIELESGELASSDLATDLPDNITPEQMYENQGVGQNDEDNIFNKETPSKPEPTNLQRFGAWMKAFSKTTLGTATRMVGGAAGGAICASPMLWRGIENFKLAKLQNELAKAQETTGPAQAALQRNNMYYQFLHQVVQRAGNIMQEEVSDASEVIQTYASITSAYRGITYGLANAV